MITHGCWVNSAAAIKSVLKPTCFICRVAFLGIALNEKCPSASVMVALRFPKTSIVAPGMVFCSKLSNTLAQISIRFVLEIL